MGSVHIQHRTRRRYDNKEQPVLWRTNSGVPKGLCTILCVPPAGENHSVRCRTVDAGHLQCGGAARHSGQNGYYPFLQGDRWAGDPAAPSGSDSVYRGGAKCMQKGNRRIQSVAGKLFCDDGKFQKRRDDAADSANYAPASNQRRSQYADGVCGICPES